MAETAPKNNSSQQHISRCAAFLAGAFGAVSGGILGMFAPEGQVTKFVAVKTLTAGGIIGGFNAFLNDAELAFGGPQKASTSSSGRTTTQKTPSLLNQSPQAQSQSSSFSLLNAPPSSYLNVGIKGFAQGFSFGTDKAFSLCAPLFLQRCLDACRKRIAANLPAERKQTFADCF